MRTELLVLGGGPGGYAAAFMAADLGMQVTLVNRDPHPGGECSYRGCIPSKALLHAAKVLRDAREAATFGIVFGQPEIELGKLRAWKNSVVDKLTGGLAQIGKYRNIRYVQATGRLLGANRVQVQAACGDSQEIHFEKAILATGSRPVVPPIFSAPSNRVWDSTDALELTEIPRRLLVIGGGYIGIELGSFYAALGSQVTVVEATGSLLAGADRDLVRILQRSLEGTMSRILLSTRVTGLRDLGDRVEADLEPGQSESFDRALVAVGRRPNSDSLGLEQTSIEVNGRGFVQTDEQGRTAEEHIFAIGDLSGEPMLAHRATHQGRLAAEVLHGSRGTFAPVAIPAVVFTDPELAWAGLTEQACQDQGIPYEVARFPWAASGRALTLQASAGLSKMVVNPDNGRLLGVGIVGPGAGELIGEAVLALEMSCSAEDIGLTIHAHPTLAETLMNAADVHQGNCTEIYKPKRK